MEVLLFYLFFKLTARVWWSNSLHRRGSTDSRLPNYERVVELLEVVCTHCRARAIISTRGYLLTGPGLHDSHLAWTY